MKVTKAVNYFLDYHKARPGPLKRSSKDAQTVKKKERKLFKSLLNAYLPEWEKVLKRRNGINDRKP